jgi:DNA processing protein
MSTASDRPTPDRRTPEPTEQPCACTGCLRGSWLLGKLSARLELCGRDPSRLIALLDLPDRELIDALGGRSRAELLSRYLELEPERLPRAPGVELYCRHVQRDPRAPGQLIDTARALHLLGGRRRLAELLATPVAVITGTSRPSDYGVQRARCLARGLASAGVTVASGFAAGIPAAAHTGALEIDGPTLTVMAGGVDVCRPAGRQTLYQRLRATGCLLSELPCGFAPRRWCDFARARLLIGLASIVIVVEAHERTHELALARMALTAGRTVAALPGRVTSATSRGTHALLLEGAQLVRDPEDVLDAIGGFGKGRPMPRTVSDMDTQARDVFERVGVGHDTLAKLTAGGADPAHLTRALAELEMRGALTRGDGGRYVPSCGRLEG